MFRIYIAPGSSSTSLPCALLPMLTHTLYLLFKVNSAASKTKNSMSCSRNEEMSTSNTECKRCLIMRVVQTATKTILNEVDRRLHVRHLIFGPVRSAIFLL